MALEAPTYDDEKALWRKIYGSLLLESEALSFALEEMEVALDQEGWTIDMDMVITYVMKTLKRFKEEDTDELPLLEMFASEDELEFGKKLLQASIDTKVDRKSVV